MNCRGLSLGIVAGISFAVLLSMPSGVVGQTAVEWMPVRTPWGDPDLQGIWNNATRTPLERPAQLADTPFLTEEEATEGAREALERRDAPPRPGTVGTYNAFWSDSDRGTVMTRTSLIVDPPDGRIPALTPEAQKREAARADVRRGRGEADSALDRNRWERCLARGLPMTPGPYNNTYQIFQNQGYVVIFMEMVHDTRIIPLDQRPHGTIRSWLGDSRGRWEGDTLVVDTTSFVDQLDGGRYLPSHPGALFAHRGSGEMLYFVERFTRVDHGRIEYEFTMNDPTTFTRPWIARVPMQKTEDLPFEYACHEGNHGMVNILRGARVNDAAGNPELGGGDWRAGR
jgi:hypothetical protein